MDVVIRRYGNMIDLSDDGVSPLNPCVVDFLRPKLSYAKKIFLAGHQRYSPDGTRGGNIEFENRYCFSMEQGRLVTTFGFLPRVQGLLSERGIRIQYYDLSPPRERLNCYDIDWARAEQHVQFRHPVQRHGLEQIAGNQCGMFVAPPGYGKTHTLEALCHLHPNAHIDIAVKPVDVANRIWRQLSHSHPNVGIVGGGARARGERITVYTADSLHLSDGNADIFVGDEAHLLVAERCAAEIGKRYLFSRNFGMTATPKGRGDGTDIRMEMFFGPRIFDMTYSQGVACGLIVPIRVRWLPIRLATNPAAGKTGIVRERHGLWRNEERHAIIAADVRANYGPEHQILILCAKVEHAIRLSRHLPEFSLCYGEQELEEFDWYREMHFLPAGAAPMTPTRREQLRAAFAAGTLKKVIATDVWATGVDFEPLQVVYRVDGRKSETLDQQGPSRASRLFDGKTYGELNDCCDTFDDALYSNSTIRRRNYESFGWEQYDWVQKGSRGHL